jgi:hypothetical protein
MPASRGAPIRIDRLLGRLESARREGGAQRGVEDALSALARSRFGDPERLVRFHDALLYFSAFPSRPAVRRRAESILRAFEKRVAGVEDDGGVLEDAEHSGVAGTSVTTSFSFDLLARLRRLRGTSLRIEWGLQDAPDRLGAGLARFLPAIEEESLVDANVPYAAWLDAARKEDAVSWILSRFESLAVPPVERAELFDALALSFRWSLGRSRWSRTRLRIRGRPPFFHGEALLARRDIDLRAEAVGRKLPAWRLAPADGVRALDAARAALAARYREFYVFNHADAERTVAVDAERGLRFHLFGLPPARRLPLRGGSAFLIVRNGVPIGYGDGFMLFERVDLSFNIFPEYRDGETAFVFARLLRTYRRTFGVTVFSIDPYQIGFGNEEAIESGAFWFYRRLGFRSVSPALEELARREDARIARSRSYRSSPRALRRLAAAGLIFDAANSAGDAWNRFHIRHIGLAVERRMAESGLSAKDFRARCAARLQAVLPVGRGRRDRSNAHASSSLAIVLDLVPGLARWSNGELRALSEILGAKSAPTETAYVHLLQRHARLRKELLRLGSRGGIRDGKA